MLNEHALRQKILIFSAISLLVLLVISGWSPYDRATWLMEVFPIIIVLPLLAVTYKKFPLTTLLYIFIYLHAIVLMVGGSYTYARVPLGFQLQEWLALSRNPYDKIGHLFQGFVPALVTREILVRGSYIKGARMLFFVVVCIVLAISVTYEFIEWGAALWLGQGADEFLGTQGDPWDTQSDMFFAGIGALLALLTCSGLQNKMLQELLMQKNRKIK